MFKLKFLILFIFVFQVVPNIIEFMEKELDGSTENKCTKNIDNYLNKESEAQCVERNSFLPNEADDYKCCFFSLKIDPILPLKKSIGENWKK